MDYTPISARTVFFAFAVTAFVAMVPMLFVFLQHAPLRVDSLGGPQRGYPRVVLGAETVALTLVLVALLSVAIVFVRRVVRRQYRV